MTDILDHPYINEDRGIISMMQQVDREFPLTPKYKRFKESQRRLEFYGSDEFKEAERKRIEASKPTEHEIVGYGRVYCPNEDRVRPDWLCQHECEADEKTVMDEDWNE